MNDLTQVQSSHQGQKADIRSVLPQKHVDRIFARLTAMYGHRFTSLFKNEDQLDLSLIHI